MLAELTAWRKEERQRLLALRMSLSQDERAAFTSSIAEKLDGLLPDPAGRVIGLYWPFRGEPDLRPWAQTAIDKGARIALPVVVRMAHPLIFRHWVPGAALERGIWNIPVPADGEEVTPDIVISPLVGFDDANYRLGYGGGFYDRTLAAMPSKPTVIGVGYSLCRIATINPQPFDIPMDRIVTETG